jgi:hypothetical protein
MSVQQESASQKSLAIGKKATYKFSLTECARDGEVVEIIDHTTMPSGKILHHVKFPDGEIWTDAQLDELSPID